MRWGSTVLPGFAGSRLGRRRSNARRSVLDHIQRLWPGERGALMQAMLIGGRAFIGRDIAHCNSGAPARITSW